MKLSKALVCALAMGAITFVTNAAPSPVILAKLNLSGTITVNTNTSATTKGNTTSLKPSKRSFNTKDVVNLLNASTNFQAWLLFQTGNLTNLPAKTTFAWDIYDYEIWAVPPSGDPILMLGNDSSGALQIYMLMDFDQMNAAFSYNGNNNAGSEQDQLSEWSIEINDNMPQVTDIFAQGQMNLNWSAGPVSSLNRKLSVSDNFSGSGSCIYKGWDGTDTVKASGSGTAASVSTVFWPFYWWVFPV